MALSLLAPNVNAFVAPSMATLQPRITPAITMQETFTPPGISRPAYLTGELAADWGVDPLNFIEKFKGYSMTVPAMETTKRAPMDESFTSLKEVNDFALYGKELKLVPGTTERSLMWMREAEIKHSRLAMLAAAGWPLAELWHGLFCKITGAQYMLDVTQGRSLSVLNGGLGEVWPFMLFLAISISAVECATLDQVYGLTPTGMTMKSNGRVVMKSYVPGDCGFDPLGLYGWFGNNRGVMDQMRAEKDPMYAYQLACDARKEMEASELANGRLAMLAITGFALQEAVWGTPVVDQTPIFFTFFGDLLAPGSLSGFFDVL